MDGMRSVSSELHLEKHSMPAATNIPPVSFSGGPLPPALEGILTPDVLRSVFAFDPKVLTQFRQDLMRSWPNLCSPEGVLRSYQREVFDKGLPNEAPKKEIKETTIEKREDLPKDEKVENKEIIELKAQSRSHNNSFISYMQDVQRSSKITDAVLVADGGFIKTHCCLLACASPFLKDALKGNTDFPIIMFVPGISYSTLKNLIDCIYMESPSINSNIQDLIDAAKYLCMNSLIPVLTDALSQQKEFRSKVNVPSVDLTANESDENFGKRKNSNLHSILNQKFNHLPPDEREVSPSSNPYLPENSGILGELLTKNEFARTNFNYPQTEPSRSNTPLNLSKGKPILSGSSTTTASSCKNAIQNASSYFPGLNSSPYLGFPMNGGSVFSQFGSNPLNCLISGQYSSYPTATTATTKIKTTSSTSKSRSNKSYSKHTSSSSIHPSSSSTHLSSSSTHPSSSSTHPSSSSTHLSSSSTHSSSSSTHSSSSSTHSCSSSTVIPPILTNNNKNKSPSSSSNSSSSPYMLKNNPFTQEILQDLYEQVKSNPQLASISSTLNPLSGLPNLGSILNIQSFQSLFPNLFQSSSNSEGKTIKREPLEMTTNVSKTSVLPLNSESVALNLSSSSEIQENDTPTDYKAVDVPLSITTEDSTKLSTEPIDFSSLPKSFTSLPSSIYSKTLASSSDSSSASFVSSQSENNSISTVLTSTSSLINSSMLMPSTNLLTRAPFDTRLNLPFGPIGLPFPLPLSPKFSMPPHISISDSKLDSSNGPVDLSPGSIRKSPENCVLHEEQISDSFTSDIDVVGSPAHESFLPNHIGSKFSSILTPKMHSDLSAILQPKDSKPATPDSIEVLEDTNSTEPLSVPQRPVIRKHLFQAGNMGRKRKGCGECEGCQVVEDCSQCRFCRDKAKFGGPNRLKQVCVYKRCVVLDSELDETRKRRKGLQRRKHARCGTCDGCKQTADCQDCYSCMHNASVQPPTRKKVCEMRICEQQQMDEVRASLNAAEEPSPYSTDSLITDGVVLALANSRTESPNSEGLLLTTKHKLKLTKKMVRKLNQSINRVTPSKVRTKYYCGECPGCQTTTPCGACLYCEDMPKFGGAGRYRQKCVKQLCVYHPRLQALKLTNKPKINLDDRSLTPDMINSLTEMEHASTILRCPPSVNRTNSKKSAKGVSLQMLSPQEKTLLEAKGVPLNSTTNFSNKIKTNCWNPYLMKGTDDLSARLALANSVQPSIVVPASAAVLNPISLGSPSLFSSIATLTAPSTYDATSIRHSLADITTSSILANSVYNPSSACLSNISFNDSKSITSTSSLDIHSNTEENSPERNSPDVCLDETRHSLSPELDIINEESPATITSVHPATPPIVAPTEVPSINFPSRSNSPESISSQAACSVVFSNPVASPEANHLQFKEDDDIVEIEDVPEEVPQETPQDTPQEIHIDVEEESNNDNELVNVDMSDEPIITTTLDPTPSHTPMQSPLPSPSSILNPSPTSSPSPPPLSDSESFVMKRRGRGRGRGGGGKGRGRGKVPVGVRKRGRRRKTPRFIIDPEDHSDYEDNFYYPSEAEIAQATTEKKEDDYLPVDTTDDVNEKEEIQSNSVPSNNCATDVYEFEDPPTTNTYTSSPNSLGARANVNSNSTSMPITSNGTSPLYLGVGQQKANRYYKQAVTTTTIPPVFSSAYDSNYSSCHQQNPCEKYKYSSVECPSQSHPDAEQRDVNENLGSSTA